MGPNREERERNHIAEHKDGTTEKRGAGARTAGKSGEKTLVCTNNLFDCCDCVRGCNISGQARAISLFIGGRGACFAAPVF